MDEVNRGKLIDMVAAVVAKIPNPPKNDEPRPAVRSSRDVQEEPVFSDGALEFLKRAADGKHRIVCSCDLTTLQIAGARACHRFYVEPFCGLGWALLPWELSTLKDTQRIKANFKRPLRQ